MSSKYDLLDDLIDISQEFKSITSPLDSLAKTLIGDDSSHPYDKDDYTQRPNCNEASCINCMSGISACTKCLDVCPTDAIDLQDGFLSISSKCVECGLCCSVCPSEALWSTNISPRVLIEKIVTVAEIYDECYITCASVLTDNPSPNVVVLPSFGCMTKEVWLWVLSCYSNISVYLPLNSDVDDSSKSESMLYENIDWAESISGVNVGLEVDFNKLNTSYKRTYQRKQFVESFIKGSDTEALFRFVGSKLNTINNDLDLVIKFASEQLISGNLSNVVLNQNQQLLLDCIARHPGYIDKLELSGPVVDIDRCVSCGVCGSVCPVGAISFDDSGLFRLNATYCVGCGMCARVCETNAVTMGSVKEDVLDFISLVRAYRARIKKLNEVSKAKQINISKQKLERSLDMLERLSDN